MSYMSKLLEEAEVLLNEQYEIYPIEESSGRGPGSGGNSQSGSRGNGGKNAKLGKLGRLKSGNYILFSGSKDLKKDVNAGIIVPYGFENIDITNQKDLNRVLVSIKRRRDIEASRMIVEGAVLGITSFLCKGVSSLGASMASNPSDFGSTGVAIGSSISTFFNVASSLSAIMAVFMELTQVVDVVRATKAIGKVRQNIMDAYDTVSTNIINTKPAGSDHKAIKTHQDLLKFRDSLREYELKLATIGGVGATSFANTVQYK